MRASLVTLCLAGLAVMALAAPPDDKPKPSDGDQASAANRRGWPETVEMAAVAAVLLVVCYSLFPTNVLLRIFHDEASFSRFMSSQVRTTATIEEIQRSLGDGKVVTERDREKLLATVQDFCRQTPHSYPDGVDADDQFVGYDLGGHITYLQFRKGVLVNFNPREYDEPFQFAASHP